MSVRVDGCYVTDWRDGSLFARFFEDDTVMMVPIDGAAGAPEALALSRLVPSSVHTHRASHQFEADCVWRFISDGQVNPG